MIMLPLYGTRHHLQSCTLSPALCLWLCIFVGLATSVRYTAPTVTVLYVVTCFLSLVMRFRWTRYVASLLRKQEI